MKSPATLIAALALLAFGASSAYAEDAVLLAGKDVKFGLVDPKDPMTGEMAVLSGDPSKPGAFTLRLRLKSGYVAKTHSHSTAEYVTVLSGKGRMSFGDVPDEANAMTFSAGSFLYLPAGQTHTLWIDEDTTADLYSTGPFDEKYVQN